MMVSGKVIVVTGGGAGIGREVVLELLRRGARVAAVDVNAVGMTETATLAGAASERLSQHAVNIANREVVMQLPKEVIAAHGQIDGLINVAGIIHKFKRVNDLDFEDIERVVNVNFWGPLNLVKAFLPVLLERPEAHLALVSSMGGYAPVPGQTIYGATKAAVKLLSEGLHSELMGTKVGVTTVFPGAVATGIAVNSGAITEKEIESMDASKYKTTPASVAGQNIVDGFERKAYRVFVGSDAKTMDLLTRLMPERAAAIIFKQMRGLLG
jgi:NAD(P)-dependent dehydrogenase (short-subunit alcohol dehydrogenase family)